ncbi:MAG: glycyl-radical enzyme activating protein [Oscillospiraceae bacterium]|nr:glycyl-radical enzyme activating protein [Oscillospiraceae bacterium]
MEKALINNIQGYSIHDGPGIRTTVFFKGCSLHCKWCANPEGILPHTQIGFIRNLCKECGKCYDTCKNGAININPKDHRINYDKCIACGKCVEACFYGALTKYGKLMSVDEVFQKVIADKLFYDASKGGVTVSGGEPLLHANFVAELFKKLKEVKIHTAIETAGFVDSIAFDIVAPYTNLFLFDIKHIDPQIHELYTGHSNELILSNAKNLINNGSNVLFRLPLISGINDGEVNINQISKFLKNIGAADLQLMPYHRMGESKYLALNMPYECANIKTMTAQEVNNVKMSYIKRGINCSISV